MNISKRLSEQRAKKKWSKVELAKRAGLCHQTIYNIESGSVNPNTETLNNLAKALDINPAIFWL